jgi:hypothetical protein
MTTTIRLQSWLCSCACGLPLVSRNGQPVSGRAMKRMRSSNNNAKARGQAQCVQVSLRSPAAVVRREVERAFLRRHHGTSIAPSLSSYLTTSSREMRP